MSRTSTTSVSDLSLPVTTITGMHSFLSHAADSNRPALQNLHTLSLSRYWTMYKLPMFGCTDPSQVLTEIQNAATSFPDAFIRICGFDSVRQTQCASFLVHRPPSADDYRAPDARSR